MRRVLDNAGAREFPTGLLEFMEGATIVSDANQELAHASEPTVTVNVPGLVAEHLHASPDTAVREAVRDGETIRRGQGYSVRVTAPLSVHQAMAEETAHLIGTPADRKAHQVYKNRVLAANPS